MITRGGKMRAFYFFLLLAIAVHATTGQAPGDEDNACLGNPLRPTVINQDILMASFNYRELLEGNGGPWIVVDRDTNNDVRGGTSTPMVRLYNVF